MSELLPHPPERYPKLSYLGALFGGEATSESEEARPGRSSLPNFPIAIFHTLAKIA